jgi:hypothetical protein
MNNKSFLLVLTMLILEGIFSPAFSQKDSASAKGWRNSWKKFAETIVDFKNHAPKFPQCGLNSLIKGGEVIPSDWPVMKKFNGLVVFEGKLMSLKNSDSTTLMKGQPFNLDFMMSEEGPSGIAKPLYVYPKKSVVQKWKTIPVGSTVRFRAKIAGICGIPIDDDRCLYVVLLTEAEPIEVK